MLFGARDASDFWVISCDRFFCALLRTTVRIITGRPPLTSARGIISFACYLRDHAAATRVGRTTRACTASRQNRSFAASRHFCHAMVASSCPGGYHGVEDGVGGTGTMRGGRGRSSQPSADHPELKEVSRQSSILPCPKSLIQDVDFGMSTRRAMHPST